MRRARRTSEARNAAPPVVRSILQRRCDCGNHTPGGGECEECRKERTGTLQRAALRSPAADEAPPVVHGVLSSPGRPLDRAARDFLEPRFGPDFSRVRLRTGGPADPRGRLTVGRPDDAYEREADRVAEGVTRSGGAEVAREGRYDFGDVRIHTDRAAAESARAVGALAYTVGRDVVFAAGQYAPASPEGRALLAHELTHVVQQEAGGAMVQRRRRLFGRGFKDQELQEYLGHLEKRGPERGPDSDVKAREVLKRRERFVPLPVEVQSSLCEELLVGRTSRRDEKAILELLQNATPGARQTIAKRVGRDRLWAAFEGRRRRVVEALTLSETDFADPQLFARLKSLPERQLEQYRAAAIDPAVWAAIDKILKLQKISTPLGFDTPVDEAGVAHLVAPGFKIKILPDVRSGDISAELRAHTEAKPDYDSGAPEARKDTRTGLIQSFDPQPDLEVTIVTRYGPGIFSTSKADYGRGTTPEDEAARTENLQFHEGSHGTDILDYLKTHRPPQFPGQKGVPAKKYAKMKMDYQELVDAYFEDLKKATVKKGDCVGIKISGRGLEELKLSRTFCSEP